MKLHADKGSGNYIQSVPADAVVINGQRYEGPVIVSAERIEAAWCPAAFSELTIDDFKPALDLDPEVILFGTGPTHRFASNHLVTEIMSTGVGFEVMSTAAAARTYNILSAENRRVVAALLVG